MFSYIDIINILLVIILVVLLVYIGYEIYLTNQPVKKYEAQTFDDKENIDTKNLNELERPKVILDYKLEFKNLQSFTGYVSLDVKTSSPDVHFIVDWGNGLQIPYSGSSFTQKLPPVFYRPGFYTITVFCNANSFDTIKCNSSIPNAFLQK
jgi:hypothetical protein